MDLLTEDEQRFVALMGEGYGLLCRIIPGTGFQRQNDLREAVSKIHDFQHAVLANAAARAYPGLYRGLGHSLVEIEPMVSILAGRPLHWRDPHASRQTACGINLAGLSLPHDLGVTEDVPAVTCQDCLALTGRITGG